jgi:hypothetical protein
MFAYDFIGVSVQVSGVRKQKAEAIRQYLIILNFFMFVC